jgi:hypothetical protein
LHLKALAVNKKKTMNKNIRIIILIVIFGIALYGTFELTKGKIPEEVNQVATEWQKDFNIEKRTLISTGKNPYFVLEPGYEQIFESETEKLTITVLDETMDVGGIITRVVEEREWKNGHLIEVSKNFFAMCKDTKDIFYFGEDVDDYINGKVTSHGGEWRANTHNNKPGLIMPGAPEVGMKYYQEIAPGVAMDRAEVISLNEKLETPAGYFDKCLKTMEGSALKIWEREYKIYAEGVGLLRDGNMLLVKYGFIK